jgi:hypothetical protein
VSKQNLTEEMPMPNCTKQIYKIGRIGRKKIEANFGGGDISTEAGTILLQRVNEMTGLLHKAAKCIQDTRAQGKIKHTKEQLLTQRVLSLCQGHGDVNDQYQLRNDILMQVMQGREEGMASSATYSRMENSITREDIVNLSKLQVELFISTFKSEPSEIILDIDASDIATHGDQEGSQYHGFYRHTCYLPLYVYAGRELVFSMLRPSRIDGAKYSAAIVKLLVTRFRQEWPNVKVIIRADAGFSRPLLMNWCDRNKVGYSIGQTGYPPLKEMVKSTEEELKKNWETTGESQRRLLELRYGAKSRGKERRVIARLHYAHGRQNTRFVVTNLDLPTVALYDDFYCKRGEMENRIKETQLELFGTRTSCSRFWANFFRMKLADLAYTLLNRLRTIALHGTTLFNASANTIRMKLLKMGAVIIKNTRRIRILLPSHHPMREVFGIAMQRLAFL